MSTAPPRFKTANLKRGPTPEQRAWVKKLSAIGGVPVLDDEEEPTEEAVLERGSRLALPLTEAAAFSPSLIELGGEVLDIIKKIAGGRRVCVVEVVNNTNLIIFPGVAKHEGGGFFKLPPSKIEPGKSGVFVAASTSTILGVLKEGCIGELPWFLTNDTNWIIRWRFPVAGSNKGDTSVEGPDAAKFSPPDVVFTTETDVREYRFTLFGGGGPAPKPGPGPQPPPGPGPGPAPDVRSNCMVTVNNNTKVALNLLKQGHDRGDFMTFPAATVAPGGSTSFVSVETPHAKEQGCKGFVLWEVGSPAVATWRVEWDNPEEQKNTAKGTIDPQEAGFRSLEQIGQDDENVPAVFTISGGGQGPGPEPVTPEPEPEPEDFNAPPGSRQPTLRRGDKSPDGWVEYLQVQLNHHMGTKLEVNGDFDGTTEKVVIAFQQKFHLQVDGVVGNQTWAALREGKPEKPSTDGRKPHTFEEQGPEARFDNEKVDGEYFRSKDLLLLFVASVGEEPIDDFHVKVRVTPPNTKSKVRKFVIGPPVVNDKTAAQPGGGAQHHVRLENFKKTFPAKDPNAKVSAYKIEAFFAEEELGTDVFRGKIIEKD